MSFGNPLGLLALSGALAIVVIHLLRVRARRIETSTLFLLDAAPAPSRGGRRLERLRATPLFWLQLLAVLVLTWVLVEPRWLREDSSRRVVLVVDGSASMSAFEPELEETLSRNLPRLEKVAAVTEFVVLPSDPREGRLYSGRSGEEAVAAALSWKPHLGTHDPKGVLATARSIAGEAGLVVFVTDHAVAGPAIPAITAINESIELLAVGSPRANVGFAGLEVTDDGFRAIVRNYGDDRERRVVSNEDGSEPRVLELGPWEIGFLSGSFPADERVTLVLQGSDSFPLDDRLPILKPGLKTLRVFVAPELESSAFVTRFVEVLEPIERVAALESAHLALSRAPVTATSAIVLPPGRGGRTLQGPIVTERDSLSEGLEFQALVAGEASVSLPAAERVLVWQGERPLIFLHDDDLVAAFALEESNAGRVPDFVVLLNRFAERVRERTPGPERVNAELNQLVSSGARAPSEPGFFEAPPHLRGAARFADVREADLTKASSLEIEDAGEREALARNTLPDPLENVWLLVLVALALAAWVLQENEVSAP